MRDLGLDQATIQQTVATAPQTPAKEDPNVDQDGQPMDGGNGDSN